MLGSKPQRRDREPPQWWQEATVNFFRFKIARMSRDDLGDLRAEIKGAIALVQSQLEARGKNNLGWWRKASAAKGFMAEKQHLLTQDLRRRQIELDGDKEARQHAHVQRQQERTDLLKSVRELAEAGDVQAALLKLVEWLER